MRIWETSPRTFGNDLKELRLDERLTQKELAGQIGRSLDYVNKMEHGLYTPSLETLGNIQKALRIDEVRMYRRIEEYKPIEEPENNVTFDDLLGG